MKSLLRFLIFVLVVAMAVGLLYFWKKADTASPSKSAAMAARGSLAALAELDRGFTTLVGMTLPSVVSINATPSAATNPRQQLLKMLFGDTRDNTVPELGSGVIVSASGHIVTNYHVVAAAVPPQGAGMVQVSLNDGRVFPARYVGADAASDVAILKIDADGLQPIPWGNSDAVQVGQMVLAVGNPLGLQETVTQGIISAKGRRGGSEAANEFFQTDAPINRGNSGGPLVDMRGEIIGLTNSVAVSEMNPAAPTPGIGFAIPSNTVRRVFESIRDNGRFIRPWSGAVMQGMTPQLAEQLGMPDASGAIVLLIYHGSPAESAGLQQYDVVTEFNGHVIRDQVDLRNRVAETSIGQQVNIRALRGGRLLNLQATIGADPSA